MAARGGSKEPSPEDLLSCFARSNQLWMTIMGSEFLRTNRYTNDIYDHYMMLQYNMPLGIHQTRVPRSQNMVCCTTGSQERERERERKARERDHA